MKDLITVAAYTMKDMMKKKSFIISTIIILVLIVVGFNVPNIMKAVTGEINTESKMLLIDGDGIFEGNLGMLQQMNLGYDFEIHNEQISKDDIKAEMEQENLQSALIITKGENKVNVEYVVPNIGMTTMAPQEVIGALTSLYQNLEIQKLNLTPEQKANLNQQFDVQITALDNKEVGGNIFISMLLSILLFFAIYFCAYQVSTSITTEKTSRIIETLVTSTSPRIIVLGKTIGIGIVGLIQVVVLAGVALISANLFLDSELISQMLDMSQITIGLGILVVVYFILGYFAYALLYALTGSTVSKPEDIQSANTPVALIAVIGFYLAYFTMMTPTSELNVFASIFPFSSPFCMPLRVMMGVATTGEVITSIVVLLLTIAIIAQVSIKIYSSAILNYGSKMSLKDIVRVYKDKNN